MVEVNIFTVRGCSSPPRPTIKTRFLGRGEFCLRGAYTVLHLFLSELDGEFPLAFPSQYHRTQAEQVYSGSMRFTKYQFSHKREGCT